MNCSVPIDYCATNVCLNGGTCTSVGSDRGYTCTCATGYTGKNCSVDIDDCASIPCQNGEICTVSFKLLIVMVNKINSKCAIPYTLIRMELEGLYALVLLICWVIDVNKKTTTY